jgi:hypothetical protein
VAAALVGIAAGRWAWPNPNQAVLRDLPVLEQFDLLRNADSIEFLRSLDRDGVFSEEGEHAG